MNSTKKTARIAGLLYLLLGVTAIFGLNIPSGFIVRGDAAATANELSHLPTDITEVDFSIRRYRARFCNEYVIPHSIV